MKTKIEDVDAFWGSPEHMKRLREELQEKIEREEIGCAWREEVVDHLASALKINFVEFRCFWLQPLLTEGLSVERAISLIAESHFRPN